MALPEFGRRGVCMRCVLVAFLALFPLAAHAAVPHAQTDAKCGATVADNLKTARAALATNRQDSERAALECIIEAVGALDTENPIVARPRGVVLAVPFGSPDMPSGNTAKRGGR